MALILFFLSSYDHFQRKQIIIAKSQGLSPWLFSLSWEQRKLGEIAEIVGGGTPSTSIPEYWDGNIDWYAPAEIADQIFLDGSQKKITEQGYNNSSAKMLPVGTVLFTSRAGIGKTAILAKTGCTNQGFQSIVPHEGELDSYFIFSRTEELKQYGETTGAGSTFVEVSGKQMANMLLKMPPTMEEQQTIGSFFRSLDNLITLHQHEPSVIPLDPPEERSFFKIAWEQRKFSDIATRVSVMSDTPDLPRVEYEDINSGQGTLNKDLQEKISTKFGIRFQPGDVLFGKLRPYLKNWLFVDFPGIAVGDFWVLRGNEIDGLFLYSLIQSVKFDDVANQSTGTKMPRADWPLVSKTEFCVPSKAPEQRQIGIFLSGLDNLITLHQREHISIIRRKTNVKQSTRDRPFLLLLRSVDKCV